MVLITAPQSFHSSDVYFQRISRFSSPTFFLFQTATTIKEIAQTTRTAKDSDHNTEVAVVTNVRAGSATTRRQTTISNNAIITNNVTVINSVSPTKVDHRLSPTTRATVLNINSSINSNSKATHREATSSGKLNAEASTTNEEAMQVNNLTAAAIKDMTRPMTSSSRASTKSLRSSQAHQATATVEVTVAINQLKTVSHEKNSQTLTRKVLLTKILIQRKIL
jgi:hypothetical protein